MGMSETVTTPCPFHAGMAAIDTCQRCGSFTCAQCKQLHPQCCPKCAQRRAAFFFNRENLQVGDLLSATWHNVFKPYWVELSLAAFLALLIPSVASYVFQIPFLLAVGGVKENIGLGVAFAMLGWTVVLGVLSTAVQFVLQACFQRGLADMAHAVWNGHRPAFGVLFNFKAGLKAGAASLLVGLLCLAPAGVAALLIVGALAMESGLALALAIVLVVVGAVALLVWLLPTVLLVQPYAENPNMGIVEGIRLCFERGRGQRLNIFLVALLCALIGCAGMLALCIGIIPAMGLAFAYQAGLWKALSTPGTGSQGAAGF